MPTEKKKKKQPPAKNYRRMGGNLPAAESPTDKGDNEKITKEESDNG